MSLQHTRFQNSDSLMTRSVLVTTGFEAPAGQMSSCVRDLAALLSDIFNFDRAEAKVLQPAAIRDWLAPAYVYRDGFGIGHPWELMKTGNFTFWTKSGGIAGYLSELAFIPEMKTGAVLLTATDAPTISPVLGLVTDFILTRYEDKKGAAPGLVTEVLMARVACCAASSRCCRRCSRPPPTLRMLMISWGRTPGCILLHHRRSSSTTVGPPSHVIREVFARPV
jgi:CubicO group peptidase (beta-lactamase class C family)